MQQSLLNLVVRATCENYDKWRR